ncbi:MAG: universal stress protein [Dehalococcoidales bacterium]|jgi:nucleotide-binding universal stress UspA family protein
MFEKILLPLDGSILAEVAVPYVAILARKMGAEVTLLHVCPPGQQPYRYMRQVYLENVAGRLQSSIRRGNTGKLRTMVRVKVLVGDPADVISDYTNRSRIPLVVMAAFGGSGRKTWLLGSVADKVVRAVSSMVFVVRSKNGNPPEERPHIRRIFLPLDGSEVSKQALPYGLEIARKFKAGITLFGMAEKAAFYSSLISFVPYSDGMSSKYDRMDIAAKRTVYHYLSSLEKEARQEGFHVSHRVTLGVAPADDILQQAHKARADLVIMATRGRSPLSRWAFGSVAEKVLRGGDLPLLLVKEPMASSSDSASLITGMEPQESGLSLAVL